MYLLDDSLNALDIYVGKWIFEKAILGFLREQGKAIVFVTNNLHFLDRADHVILMEEGQMRSIQVGSQEFDEIVADYKRKINMEENEYAIEKEEIKKEDSHDDKKKLTGSFFEELEEDEEAQLKKALSGSVIPESEEKGDSQKSEETGDIKMSVLKRYLG